MRINGQAVSSLPLRDDGLLAVRAPQGAVNISVDWTTTPDVILARWLSAMSVLAITALCLVERRLLGTRLK